MAEPQVTMGFSVLEGLLRPSISDYLQEHQLARPSESQEQELAGPSGSQDQSCFDADPLMLSLRKFLGDMKHTDSAPAGLAGIQLPEVDAELADVQAEVDDILHRLSKQRADIPSAMAVAIQRQLQALRPEAQQAEQPEALGGDAAMATAVAQEAAGLAAVRDAGAQEAARLQQMLSKALNKLPAVRAQLEQAEQRLARNLCAVEADRERPSPRTAERVMMNRTNLEAGGGHGGEAPGSALTKRVLARELAHG